MATRFLIRSQLNIAKKTLSSAFAAAKPTRSLSSLSLVRPLITASANIRHCYPAATAARGLATLQSTPPSFPKSYELPEGLDFEHWQVYFWTFPMGTTSEEMIDTYVKTLAMVFGSEEEARRKIYAVSTDFFYFCGIHASDELAAKIRGMIGAELPTVASVAPDCYMFPEEKKYGGDPFINGQAVYDPQYHEEIRAILKSHKAPPGCRSSRFFKKKSKNFEERREDAPNSELAASNMGEEVVPA